MPSCSGNSSQKRIERLARHLSSDRPPGLKDTSRDELTLQSYSQDLWPRRLLELRENGPAEEPVVDLVLWPETADEISAIVRWASVGDCALYPYGAGSGVCGATIPADEEERPRVIVDLKLMNNVRSIDRQSLIVWVEAGIIGENLERHLNQEGLTLGHFPSSVYCSSLGGYLATRSAGQLSTKYGKIEDMVVALECVLADGTVTRTARAPRSAVGPDWTQLFLGSEGTLGFISAAALQVHPMPQERVLLSFEAKSMSAAMEFARKILQDGLRPAVIRIYDPLETSLSLSSQVLKDSGFESGAAIIVMYEGLGALIKAEAEETKRMAYGANVRAIGDQLATHWWEHRYDVSYKQQLILSHNRTILDTFELSATWERLPEVYKSVKAASVGFGVVMAHLSHFYHTGANIYFTMVSHAGVRPSAVDEYDRAWNNLLAAATSAGATLSHHHGVGKLKREWIRKEMAPWVKIFEKVKRGFDPENRLNPDKMGL